MENITVTVMALTVFLALKKITQNLYFKKLYLQLPYFAWFSKHERFQLFRKQILIYAVHFLIAFFTVHCMWHIYILQLYFSGIAWINIYIV